MRWQVTLLCPVPPAAVLEDKGVTDAQPKNHMLIQRCCKTLQHLLQDKRLLPAGYILHQTLGNLANAVYCMRCC